MSGHPVTDIRANLPSESASKALSAYETAMFKQSMKNKDQEALESLREADTDSLRYLFSIFSIFH